MAAGTLAIAIVGAATGLASLGWQVYTWHHARKLRIKVHVRMGYLPHIDESVITITVMNENDYSVRVHSTGLVLQDGTNRDLVIIQQIPGATLPGVIAPHDDGSAWLLKSEADQAGIDVFRPVIAWANLAASGRATSDSTTLMTRD